MGVFDFLFGGKAQKVDWKQLERLMQLSTELNRYNTEGIFGGSEWTEGPDGRWTQSRTLAPGMQEGVDRMIQKFGGGEMSQALRTPDQFKSLLDAKMANQMQRHGLLPGEAMPNLQQENFGARWGDQMQQLTGDPASNMFMNQPQGPSAQPMPEQPPQGPPQAMPPGGAPPGGPPQQQPPVDEQMIRAMQERDAQEQQAKQFRWR